MKPNLDICSKCSRHHEYGKKKGVMRVMMVHMCKVTVEQPYFNYPSWVTIDKNFNVPHDCPYKLEQIVK